MAKRIYTIDREATKARILEENATILDFVIARKIRRQYSTLVQTLRGDYRGGGCQTDPESMYQKMLARLHKWGLLVEAEAEHNKAA